MTAAENLTSALLSNRYRVLNVLGDGGFGKTFLVEDTQMPSNRRCVLKQLKPIQNNPATSQLVKERFQREAAILETLGEAHTQIPRLYAYFSEKGEFYLVEEWIEGDTLAQKVEKEGPLSESLVQSIVVRLLPAIAHVHQEGIIHRDIKPDNIILSQQTDTPVLIDFGAVKEIMSTALNSRGNSTHSIVIGTPGYMPAEQLAGRPVFASDLYGVGMTAIYLLTGKLPQEIETDAYTGALCWHQYVPSVSDHFRSFLDRAIDINIQKRFTSVEEMLSALSAQTSSVAQPTALSTHFTPKQTGQTIVSAAPPASAQTYSAQTYVVSPQSPSKATSAVSGKSTASQDSPWKSSIIIGTMISLSILTGAWFLRPQPSVVSDSESDTTVSETAPDEPASASIEPAQTQNSTSAAQPTDPPSNIPDTPAPAAAPTPNTPVPNGSIPNTQRVQSSASPALSAVPQADSGGNYWRWGNGYNWRVSDSGQLNCRRGPSISSSVRTTFMPGSQGRIASATPIQTSADGKPWLEVDAHNGSCFVRANSKYVVPTQAVASAAQSAPSAPVQDSEGNYISWQNRMEWRVVTGQLNCRQSPSVNAPVLSKAVEGRTLFVNSTPTSPLVFSGEQKPWLRVAGPNGSCFVRANSSYIVPQ